MANPTDTEAPKAKVSGRGGPRWLTATELHSYVEATFGVRLHKLYSPRPTFQSWAKTHNIRKREFRFEDLPEKTQQARVAFVEQGSFRLYQKPTTVLRRCRYEFNVSDVRKHVAKLVAKHVDEAAKA